MTDAGRDTAILDDLDAALRGPLGVRRVDRLEDFIAPGKSSRYLRAPRLTLALHFDIEPAFLILDPLLGTLGAVEFIAPDGDARGISHQVRRCVDRSSYLRHLLLRDRQRDRRPLAVELVLLTADAAAGETSALEAIGAALRAVLQDTDSLFHIGVSVLSHGGPGKRFDGRLRRAFPWLLTAARRWLASPRANPDEAMAGNGQRTVRRIRLDNYRLPGVREITLADARVHLMHGPNGSGKSSIAEALEIVTCGTVKRLVHAGADKYGTVIRNSNQESSSPATVQIGWTVGGENRIADDPARPVLDTGVADPLDRSIDVGSFRLDQPLMDRLIGQSPYERAKVFLDAFFPTAVSSRGKYEQAAHAHQRALAGVDAVVERLSAAKEVLTGLRERTIVAVKQTAEPFPTVLNRWLEQMALVDLLQRQRIVRATLTEARSSGWTAFDAASGAAAAALAGEIDIAALARFEQQGKETANELWTTLASFKRIDAKEGDHAAISRAATETLNAVGRFLFTPDTLASFGHFGDKIAAVFNGADAQTYGPIIIGNEQWADPVIRDLDALIDACSTLRVVESTPPDWAGTSGCPEYEEARLTHDALREAGRELSRNFIDKLQPDAGAAGEFDGSLIAALNEVIALFTPARWAYPDIELPTNLEGGRVGVGMNLGAPGAPRAEIHLNTAELNLFTVALFLLCVGRVPKPLNLLIFDDPLQNMDELTSTALARGMAKIVRLWSDLRRTEEMLILFHGYNDLDRFGSEVAAARYRLPWLSPAVTTGPVTVTAESPGGDVLAVQQIEGMLPRFSE